MKSCYLQQVLATCYFGRDCLLIGQFDMKIDRKVELGKHLLNGKILVKCLDTKLWDSYRKVA